MITNSCLPLFQHSSNAGVPFSDPNEGLQAIRLVCPKTFSFFSLRELRSCRALTGDGCQLCVGWRASFTTPKIPSVHGGTLASWPGVRWGLWRPPCRQKYNQILERPDTDMDVKLSNRTKLPCSECIISSKAPTVFVTQLCESMGHVMVMSCFYRSRLLGIW